MNTILNKERMLKNINGLSVGDSANCGPYGKITCTESILLTENVFALYKVTLTK